MQVIIDIETDVLVKPTKIWCIVCKDIATGTLYVFRNLTEDEDEKKRFTAFSQNITRYIGHNFLGFDWPVLVNLLSVSNPDIASNTIDTLIISKLIDYSREFGHSIETYGIEFNFAKGKNFYVDFFKSWSQELEDYCVRDVEICEKIYNKYLPIINDPNWQSSIHLEQSFQLICNDLHNNGFSFNVVKANKLLEKVTKELRELDEAILKEFQPREVLIREFIPKPTKFGTISKMSVPRSLWGQIHSYEVGTPYRHTRLDAFNPSSHKQIIQVLNEAGWKPEEKTKTHVETERELQRLKYSREAANKLDIESLSDKLLVLKKTGWKVNEVNLATLPSSAPAPARTLAKRILLEARRRSLTEWIALVSPATGRIHGKFYGIGAWTHRMAHQQPNTANIPRDLKEDGTVKLLGRELRELWCAPRNRLLVGVDAEGIQLRIFAHYIDDKEFTEALIKGNKNDKSDPHSLNKRILGDVCKTRQAAKRFIYALLLGAGLGKLSQILECSDKEVRAALDNLLTRYEGFERLRRTDIERDSRRGWFTGIDGRHVAIPGDTAGTKKHLCMSGYLQNGEAIVVKRAALIIDKALEEFKKQKKWMFVNIVHDELQSETKNDMEVALHVAKIKADAIKEAGEHYKLKCPMAGSYFNEDTKDYTIGTNWFTTH